MNINKIGGISGNIPSRDFSKVGKSNSTFNDSINISPEAKSRISFEKTLELVKSIPDVRADKIADAKNNLENYFTNGELNAEITDKIAKNILKDISEGLV